MSHWGEVNLQPKPWHLRKTRNVFFSGRSSSTTWSTSKRQQNCRHKSWLYWLSGFRNWNKFKFCDNVQNLSLDYVEKNGTSWQECLLTILTQLIFETYIRIFIFPPAFLGLLLGGGRHIGSVMASTIVRLNAELTQVSSFHPVFFLPDVLRHYLESIDVGYENFYLTFTDILTKTSSNISL